VRSGKKAIIVFTDGADNPSSLSAEIAIERAKIVGAPVYGYLLAYRPSPAQGREWRMIEVRVAGKSHKVRAREGYYP